MIIVLFSPCATVQALAVGAQMKMAHKLRSPEHISRRELEKVLKGSLGTAFEVEPAEMEIMITGIMKVRWILVLE